MSVLPLVRGLLTRAGRDEQTFTVKGFSLAEREEKRGEERKGRRREGQEMLHCMLSALQYCFNFC